VVTAATRAAPIVTPDPLTPRIVNADALRQGSATHPRATRAFGPPSASGHPIAGYVQPTLAASYPDPGASSQGPAPGSVAFDTRQWPIDELDRLVATDPVYPPVALRNHIEGWVEVEFTITAMGTVSDIEVLGAEPRGIFEAAATEAVRTWRFRPRVVNGSPVPQRSVMTLRFNLDR
jgi:TonB family protein